MRILANKNDLLKGENLHKAFYYINKNNTKPLDNQEISAIGALLFELDNYRKDQQIIDDLNKKSVGVFKRKSFRSEVASMRRYSICNLIHGEQGHNGHHKEFRLTEVYKIIGAVFKISPSTVRDIHKKYCNIKGKSI